MSLVAVAIAALLWKIDLFEWVQASVDVPDLALQMADSEHWVVASVSDGDTLCVGLNGQEKKICRRTLPAHFIEQIRAKRKGQIGKV